MSEPPKPGLPPYLLSLLARLVWTTTPGAFDATGIALGTFGDTALYVVTGEQWAAGSLITTSPALGPFLASEGTAAVIQRGTFASDGAIAFNGTRYHVQAITENGRNIAKAIPVT